jgi:molecular chaperone DnaJ
MAGRGERRIAPPAPTGMRDYYAVLGVGAASTSSQIRRAYQRLARRYSPDVNLWDREAQSLFDEISQAYRVLSDPAARRLYDQQDAGIAQGDAGERPPRGRRGDDLHVPVDLAFAQAYAGLTLDMSVERLSPCPACRASGEREGAPAVPCAHCGATGVVWMSAAGRVSATPCPACDGSGERVVDPCPGCRGRGVRPARAAVAVAIPPGMDTGAQLRLAGQGHTGPLGGPRGDLVIITRIADDPVFTRKGDNLHAELAIGVVEAVLGARMSLATLAGPIDLVLPPGTQSGQVFRIRGKGMPRLAGEGRGDLYVTARIETPQGIDARTQELFREIGRLLPESPRGALRRGAPA